MKLSLQSLRLKNFKGITEFSLDIDGADALISGANETGKTTFVDAFTWLLFGKDSAGAANFQLKPVDAQGAERHNLETEVEAHLDIDGKKLVLMRRFKEKYTKRRGEANKEFTGHTTDFFIDEVPAKEKEFIAKVAGIIDIDTFKLVTSPYEFNNLPWSKRRDILLEMCGDEIPNDDVIDSLYNGDKERHIKLNDILSDCSASDHKKKVKSKQTDINNELKQIPVRISEQQTVSTGAEKPGQKDIKRLEKQIEDQQEKRRQLKSNERLSAKNTRLSEINTEISNATGNAQDQEREKKRPIYDEIDNLDGERRAISNQIKDIESDITRDKKRNKITADALVTLRGSWKEIKTEKPTIKTDCPACGQNLPEEKIKSANENFNKENAQKLESNQAEGKSLSETFNSREKLIAKAMKEVDSLSGKLPAINEQISEKQKELKAVYFQVDVEALDKEKDIVESEIKALKNGTLTQENGCKEKIAELQADLDGLKEQEATYNAAVNSRARIEELETQEKTLAAAYEKLESELFLIEQFIVRKVEMVEGQVNGAFKMATFKLFKTQINGGIEECCETLHKGVPYGRGLNNAACINVGLDIISTLSEYYGFQAPIFIDNSESVNEIIPMDAQVISLAVSTDKQLVIS